jgi:phosphoserine phosphatase
MSILHVFDMDGTLLRDTSASMEIARAVGRVPELLALEQALAAETLTTYDFAVAVYDIYAGLTPADVATVFDGCPWIDGLPRVLADIRVRGELSAVVTMSPDFFANLLRAVGADEVHASRFPELPLLAQQRPARTAILTPDDKVTLVEGMLNRLGLAAGDCIAYGDSSSDLPLFRRLRHTVAVNATRNLRAAAAMAGDGDDLWTIYQEARSRFLDPAPDGGQAARCHPTSR